MFNFPVLPKEWNVKKRLFYFQTAFIDFEKERLQRLWQSRAWRWRLHRPESPEWWQVPKDHRGSGCSLQTLWSKSSNLHLTVNVLTGLYCEVFVVAGTPASPTLPVILKAAVVVISEPVQRLTLIFVVSFSLLVPCVALSD